MNSILFLAAAVCLSSTMLDKRLLEEHQETVAAFGAVNNGLLAKVYTNPETRTWTLTLNNANGRGCIFSYGGDWRKLQQQEDEK